MMSSLPLLFAVVVVLYVGFCNAAPNRADADRHVKRKQTARNFGSEDGGFRGYLTFKEKAQELLDLIKLLKELKKQDQGNSRRTFGSLMDFNEEISPRSSTWQTLFGRPKKQVAVETRGNGPDTTVKDISLQQHRDTKYI